MPIQSLWIEYEKIAMHFNDLLMRLRSQALAGIAAVSTLIGIFTKGGETNIGSDWAIATAIFIALGAFWIAVACLDLFYYNRLLIGAVAAVVQLEGQSARGHEAEFDGINLSTHIVKGFKGCPSFKTFGGVVAFYIIVFATICGGIWFSWHMYSNSLLVL